jgi:hypothetical protein
MLTIDILEKQILSKILKKKYITSSTIRNSIMKKI